MPQGPFFRHPSRKNCLADLGSLTGCRLNSMDLGKTQILARHGSPAVKFQGSLNLSLHGFSDLYAGGRILCSKLLHSILFKAVSVASRTPNIPRFVHITTTTVHRAVTLLQERKASLMQRLECAL